MRHFSTRRLLTEPYDNFLGVRVDLAHLLDLMISLRHVGLIDTPGVNPEPGTLALLFSSLDVQQIEQVLSYIVNFTVDHDLLSRIIVSPSIRQAGVSSPDLVVIRPILRVGHVQIDPVFLACVVAELEQSNAGTALFPPKGCMHE